MSGRLRRAGRTRRSAVHRQRPHPQIRRRPRRAVRLPSVRRCASSRRSDDADVIRARLRALLAEKTAPAAGYRTTTTRRSPTTTAPDRRGGRRSPASDSDPDGRACRPASGATGHREARRGGIPVGRRPRRCGSPALVAALLLVGWTWLDRPAGRAGPALRPARRAAAGRPPSTPGGGGRGDVGNGRGVGRRAGGAAGTGDPPGRRPRRRRRRGRRRSAARGRSGIGQSRGAGHGRGADRRGRSGRAARGGGGWATPRGRASGAGSTSTRPPRGAGRAAGHRAGAGPADRGPPHRQGPFRPSRSWTTCRASARPSPPSWPSW